MPAPGVRLALFGRDEGRARAVAEDCRAKGALVAVILVDVTDPEAMAQAVTLVDDAHPVDLVVANAGVSGAVLGSGESIARLFAVNVMGVVHTVEPLLPRMIGTGRGPGRTDELARLVRGPPGHGGLLREQDGGARLGRGPARAVAAAGGRGLRRLPGFRRHAADPAQPVSDADADGGRAGGGADQGAARPGRRRIAFPWPVYWGARLAGALPASVQRLMTARWPGKE